MAGCTWRFRAGKSPGGPRHHLWGSPPGPFLLWRSWRKARQRNLFFFPMRLDETRTFLLVWCDLRFKQQGPGCALRAFLLLPWTPKLLERWKKLHVVLMTLARTTVWAGGFCVVGNHWFSIVLVSLLTWSCWTFGSDFCSARVPFTLWWIETQAQELRWSF